MPRRKLRLLLFLLLFPPSCLAQIGTLGVKHSLSGYIREEGSGQVIAAARVDLLNAFGSPLESTVSDGNGVYQFNEIPGDCYLAVQRDGYSSAREFVRPNGGANITKDVFLRPQPSSLTSKAANPVSQHQLSIPPKARQFFDKGVQLVVEKADYHGAIAEFSKAIAKFPDYYEAYAAMGLAQNKMGDTPAAESSFRKSISLSNEKYSQAMIDLASMWNVHNRFSDSEPLLRKAVALDAASWRANYELAVALAGEKRYADALPFASAARDAKPDNPQTDLLLYTLHIQTDNFAAAVADINAYLQLAPIGPIADRLRKLRDEIQKNATPQTPAPAASSSPLPSNPTSPDDSSQPRELPITQSAFALPTPAADFTLLPLNTDTPVPAAPKVEESSTANSSAFPPRIDEFAPSVAVNIPCSLPTVLTGAGQRAEELLKSLQKFDASERVEHFSLNAAGKPGPADVRSFDYVVIINQLKHGAFDMQEYRNGTVVTPRQFPAGIVTTNLSLHGLIFHPSLAPGFNFACEGLGEWKGHPTWLVHFEEKSNQRGSLRSYVIDNQHYALRLTGRAWIDADTYQVLRLESDLAKPVEKIQLAREHIAIEFASVQFRSRNQALWLPQNADLYVEFKGRRFYRRHTFSNFQLFSTDSVEKTEAPKESYCFTNNTDLLITGILDVTPVSGKADKPAPLILSIPAKGTVCKSVGSGKDVNIPSQFLASSLFSHDGPAGSVEVDAYQLDPTALAVVSSKNNAAAPNR